MKKQRTVTKADESRIEAVLEKCISESVGALIGARHQLAEQTALLSEGGRNLVLANALYRFFKVMWFNNANFDEDDAITNRNITEYEDFADEIISKAFFDMCKTLDTWRPSQKR